VGSIRLVAFFLTQFHPTPENDEWWGKGFTEWTNVTKAQPLFEGHHQPHLPTDLGFYDLRLRESRRDQIAMARQYGIDAFCYHYYWFSGTRVLHKPLDDMLADPDSDMPFCLCWANENWTRRWDAAEHQVLIAQKYRPEDDLEFIKSLVPFFKDPRYLQVDGAPVLVVYRPQHLPDSKRTLAVWRDYCASIGIPRLHLVCALTHGNLEYAKYGFDAGVEFPPHQPTVPSYSDQVSLNGEFRGVILDYADVANLYLGRRYNGRNVYRGVFPSWDNTARCGPNSLVVLNGTPGNYERWLGEAVRRTRQDFPDSDRLVFINAWNEWAEGCHLEPDRKHGRGFLEATLRLKQGRSTVTEYPDVGPPPRRRTLAPPPRPAARPRLPAMMHMAALRVRKVLGLLLQPFPRLRQRAVRTYLALRGQHA
jgi:lipopolysaccharide biosynthesis protein